MSAVTKADFLTAYGFPSEWLQWGLYPDQLFEGQRAACADDELPHPDEHLRYGAFLWWLRMHRSLPETTLKQLARLATLDPDPPMASAAVHDILFHPSATEEVAGELARLTEGRQEWIEWVARPTPSEYFRRTLSEGRNYWAECHAVHRIAQDIGPNQLSIDELRESFALGSPLVLRALVEHPNLPCDLLSGMATMEGQRFAKEIRTISRRRLDNSPIPRSPFIERHSKDPWSWPR